jgi:VWFA-related protein
MRFSLLRLAGLLCLLIAPAVAGNDPTQTGGVTFTAKTELVLVPVVVSDKSGNHAAGLTKDDFELLENGKPKPIVSFDEIKSTTNRPRRMAPNKGVYSNELSADASPKRLTIFALDLVNTPFMDQAFARQQLMKFLSNHVSSQEPIALIAISGGGIQVLHDFTSDPGVLVAALKKVTGAIPALNGTGPGNSLIGGVATALETGTGSELSIEANTLANFANSDAEYMAYAQRQAIMVTLESFQHVAEAYAGVPGRKSLIWATAGFPFGLDPISGTIIMPQVFSKGSTSLSSNPGVDLTMSRTGAMAPLPDNTTIRTGSELTSLEPLYQRTLQMLSDASISVYPVDARGLVVFFPGANVSQMQGVEAYNRAIWEATRDTMNDFAFMTGGKAFYNRNDLDVAFQKAADDSATYYMLSYTLDKNPKPGWHKLQVKVKRPGTEVRARNGFFVLDQKKVDARKMDIEMALVSPLDYTAVPISVRWTSLQAAGAKKKAHFEVKLPPSSNVVDTSNNNLLSLEFVAIARTATGTSADQVSQHLEANLKPNDMQLFQKEGLTYSNDILVPPGEYTVRFVVRSALDGRMGSVTAPLKAAP